MGSGWNGASGRVGWGFGSNLLKEKERGEGRETREKSESHVSSGRHVSI